MTTKEILIAARKLIEDPKNWTQGVYARNAWNVMRKADDEDACKFCAAGAVYRVCVDQPNDDAAEAISALSAPLDHRETVPDVNDRQGHAAVLAMYDRAIAACAD